ncbi:MAG TPA: beta-N-acetylhexosaminidase [Candidatus Saccharimonadia bacterium]|nr:beta-N-acetylhexosaminidase [Candidatus Saccharimonadia bacterium]
MLIVGIGGTTLAPRERDWLAREQVSGVILFTRNFESREQVTRLVDEIRAAREAPLLVTVDQEGGPVQRFRDGFTRLPPLARIGELHARDARRAVALAEEHAWLMATEMRAVGVDLSFAPVVDLKRGNRAIGDRAFDADPDVTSELALAYLRGMRIAGMAATLKHFPGHGSVLEDTHFAEAVDPRSYEQIEAEDLRPFRDAIQQGAEAVMVAHVRYPLVDELPAGYSRRWIDDILRGELVFRGAVFADDVGMAAAHSAGSVAARVAAHLDAGCDFVPVCDPSLVPEALSAVEARDSSNESLVMRLQGYVGNTWEALVENSQRQQFIERVTALDVAA